MSVCAEHQMQYEVRVGIVLLRQNEVQSGTYGFRHDCGCWRRRFDDDGAVFSWQGTIVCLVGD